MELLLSLGGGLFALAVAGYLSVCILRKPAGTPRMQEISGAVKEGAIAYLLRQYTTIAPFIVLFAAAFWLFLGAHAALTFISGAVLSATAGFVGMSIAIRANVRVAQGARESLDTALRIAFWGGAVMGLCVVGLGLLGITSFYVAYRDPNAILGFGFGASFVALFARLGGGIFTKGADIGADLVGKVEAGIPEDDPRNPAVIADAVGDNVGDVAGMGADLYESYCAAIIAAMVIALSLAPDVQQKAILLPLILSVAGIFAMVAGVAAVRGAKKDPQRTINQGIAVSACVGAVLFYLTSVWYGDVAVFYAALAGLVVMLAIGGIAQYYTSYQFGPTRAIAEASQTGTGTNILAGLANGMIATAAPIVVICAAMLFSYNFAGMYGLAIAAVGMLSLAGVAIAIDSCGAISDNAGGIVEMSGLGQKVRAITDSLDAAGNTAAAIAKGAAIGSAAMTVLALLAAYFQLTGLQSIDIAKPTIIVGLFVGGIMPFLFSALAINAVTRAAFRMVEEVRRQFREIKGLLKGKARPNYARCVDISTRAALREMIVPSIAVVVVPLAVGFVLGPEAVGGLLAGATLSGLLLAIFMTTGGAAWDNAKKYIEAGFFGGKGSLAHKAAVVGDTVGDAAKDCAGPSLNILIKIMSTISLLFASSFVAFHL